MRRRLRRIQRYKHFKFGVLITAVVCLLLQLLSANYSRTPILNSFERYQFVLSAEKRCESMNNLRLLIAIHSKPTNFARRWTIRQTYLTAVNRTKQSSVQYIFVMGMPEADIDYQNQLRILDESDTYGGDIAQQNFLGSYQNLTLLSLMMLRWTTVYCPQAKFLMKVDDDTYLNVENLLTFLTRPDISDKNRIYGYVNKAGVEPDRNPKSKWYMSKEEFKDKLPAFMSGSGYMLTTDNFPAMLDKARYIPRVVIEDMYITALLGRQIDVQLKHYPQYFGYYHRMPRQHECDRFLNFGKITSHRFETHEIETMWRTLKSKNCFTIESRVDWQLANSRIKNMYSNNLTQKH